MNNLKDDQPLKAQTTEEKLEEKLVDIELKKQEDLTEEKARELNFSYINLVGFPISPDILGLIKEDEAKKFKFMTFFRDDSTIKLAVVDPSLPEVIKKKEELAKKHHRTVTIFLISKHSFERALELYKAVVKIRNVEYGVKISEEDIKKFKAEIDNFEKLDTKLKEETNLTYFITMLLASAQNADASDIHIEAEEKEIFIRFRLDGILHIVATVPSDKWKKIVNRVKILAGLKINVNDVPQDGRISIYMSNDKLDIRVSTLPTAFGESIVMRLLKSTATSIEFSDLGITGKALKDLEKEVKRPNGMIITTGPTGSGKTTTLYAILNKINDEGNKVITLEDPIEYQMKGISQSQIDHSKDYTFASGLRSIMRQDPDVIMVGEIRDLETAETAIQAALTGHMVVSTIHTNDAAGAIPRFLSMGTKPFLLAPALNAVIGQRLVRKICNHCKEETQLDDANLEKVKNIMSEISPASGVKINLDKLKFYKGKGCPKCSDIGYKGRVGIYEIFAMDKEIEGVILSNKVSEYEMREIAVKKGMVTMPQDGILKALEGITSIEEVFRVSMNK